MADDGLVVILVGFNKKLCLEVIKSEIECFSDIQILFLFDALSLLFLLFARALCHQN
jgi:hypothetical protein